MHPYYWNRCFGIEAQTAISNNASVFQTIDQIDKGEVWGYGEAPHSKQEAIDRINLLTNTLNESNIAGWCYTQFNDTGAEHNGLTTADGFAPKLPISSFRRNIIGTL